MATVCEHLSVGELEARYLEFQNVTASRHFQVIWLVARGHTISQVPETAAYGERWIGQLLARYNTEGPEAPGGLRRRNGAPAIILNPGLLAVIGFAIRRLMAGCGRAARWRLGWLANSALPRSRRRAGEPKAASPDKAKRSATADCPERRRRGKH
jgi:Winged helix-turn helix